MRISIFPIALLAILLTACAGAPRAEHVVNYPSGQPRWTTGLRNGQPHGPSATFHENGRVSSRGFYDSGNKHGEFIYWDESGVELYRETYERGRLIASTAPQSPGAPSEAPSAVATRSERAEPKPAPADVYSQLGMHLGMAVFNTVGEMSDESRDNEGGVFGVTFLHRRKRFLAGISLSVLTEVFGPTQQYMGAIGGLVQPLSSRIHAELQLSGGVHAISGLGDGLFSTGMGQTSAQLPYVGGRLGLVMDVGKRKGLVVELAVQGRHDLGESTNDVISHSCFLGCRDEAQVWQLGGSAAEAVLATGYQF